MRKLGISIGLILLFVLGLWMHFYSFTPIKPKERMIQVHLEGEVLTPGLYTVEEGARLADLLEKAGGLTEAAEEVNLAQKLLDGEKIVIHKTWVDAEEEELEEKGKEKKSSSLHQMTMEEWLAITGIGPITAQAIMDYLSQHPQAELEDLLQVKGVGLKKLEQIRSILGKE